MDAMRYVVRWFIRFIVLWLVDAIALMVAAAILPGISFQVSDWGSYLVAAAAAAFTLGIVNLLLRPLILLLALPLGVWSPSSSGSLPTRSLCSSSRG